MALTAEPSVSTPAPSRRRFPRLLGSGSARVTRASRQIPLALWLVTALQAALMLATTVLYPPMQNPDEASHADYVVAHRHGDWLDGPGERAYQTGVVGSKYLVPDIQLGTHVGGVPVLPRSQRKSFDELGTAPVQSPVKNQMVQHPPLYYGVAAGWTYLLPDWDHQRFDVQVFWLRLFSLVLLLPVPLLIFLTARRISGRPELGLVAAMVPLAIPSYLRTGASVTNDSMLVLTFTVLLALLARVAWGDSTRRTAVFAGVAWGAALLTKGFALALPPVIVLAYLVGARGGLGARLRAALPGMVLAGAVGSLLGAWWWVRNLVVYGVVQPDGRGPLTPAEHLQLYGPDQPGGTDWKFFKAFFQVLGQRAFGSLGLIDVPSEPRWLLYTLSIVVVLLLAGSVLVATRVLARARDEVGIDGWTTGRALVMITSLLCPFLLMYGGDRSAYLAAGRLPGIQVRYLVPAVLAVAACVAVALTVLAQRAARWLPLVVLVVTMGWLAACSYTVLRVEMSPKVPGTVLAMKEAVRFVVQWAPFPAPVTAAMLALVPIVAVWLAVVLWREAFRVADDTEPATV